MLRGRKFASDKYNFGMCEQEKTGEKNLVAVFQFDKFIDPVVPICRIQVS